MAIKKEDIKPGWYWVRDRNDGELFIVRVQAFLGPTMWVEYCSEDSDDIDEALAKLDFIARIEPPEGV